MANEYIQNFLGRLVKIEGRDLSTIYYGKLVFTRGLFMLRWDFYLENILEYSSLSKRYFHLSEPIIVDPKKDIMRLLNEKEEKIYKNILQESKYRNYLMERHHRMTQFARKINIHYAIV